jgi:hypothetical protein
MPGATRQDFKGNFKYNFFLRTATVGFLRCLKLRLSILAVSLKLKYIFLAFVAGDSLDSCWTRQDVSFSCSGSFALKKSLATGCSMMVTHASF